jgi:hypothetical protein
MATKITSVLPRIRIHTVINEFLIASRGYSILKSPDNGRTWTVSGTLPIPAPKFLLSKSRIISRALRMGIHQIRQIQNDKILIWCDNCIFLSDPSLSDFKRINLNSPFFQVLDNNICVTPEFTYYGEYIPNYKKNEVRIFRTRDGENWETLYSFPKKSIKHIHLLQFDPFSQKVWFSTGDEDSECLLGYANSDFSDIEIVGKDQQHWRSLELLFTPEKIYWGTDNPDRQNWLISFDRKTRTLQKTAQFSGPIYNLKRFSQGYLILTTTEGGAGEWYKRACMWYSPEIESMPWKTCISYEKDWMPYVFGFGRLLFGVEFNNSICVSGLALKNIDNTTLMIPSERIQYESD